LDRNPLERRDGYVSGRTRALNTRERKGRSADDTRRTNTAKQRGSRDIDIDPRALKDCYGANTAGGLDARGGDIRAACANRSTNRAGAFDTGDIDVDAATLDDRNFADDRRAFDAGDRKTLVGNKGNLPNLPGSGHTHHKDGVVAFGLNLSDLASGSGTCNIDRDIFSNNGNANLPEHRGQGRAFAAPSCFPKTSFTPAEDLVAHTNRERLVPSALSPFSTPPAGDARHGVNP
jgi:hypothetical protein